MNFFRRMNPNTIPISINPQDETTVLRERILQRILLVMTGLGIAAYFLSLISLIQKHQWVDVTIFTLTLLTIVIILLCRNIRYEIRSSIILFVLYILGVSSLLESGLQGEGLILLFLFPIMGCILAGIFSGILASTLSIVTLVSIGFLMSSGKIPAPTEQLFNLVQLVDWTRDTIIFLILVVTVISSLSTLLNGLERSRRRQQELATELQHEHDSLETRVAERTKLYERRAAELEAASQLANQITMTTNLQLLLDNAAELIKKEFGFYHIGIYLLDDSAEYAILRSSTGETGRLLLASGHKLHVGGGSFNSVVGYVVNKGEPRISQNVAEEPLHYKNPVLPYTRSEMALPMRFCERIIGALDIQSEKVNAFTPDDSKILQTIANQLAGAIENTQLVSKLEQSLAEVEASYKEFTQHAWEGHLQGTSKKYAYRYQRASEGQKGNIEEGVPEYEEIEKALVSGETITTTIQSPDLPGKEISTVAIPVKLRQQVLGVLDIRFGTPRLPKDTVLLLENVTNRLALALENARLLETIQQRAEREHMVSEISSHIRASSDMDSILRTTAIELGKSLGVPEVIVQLRNE